MPAFLCHLTARACMGSERCSDFVHTITRKDIRIFTSGVHMILEWEGRGGAGAEGVGRGEAVSPSSLGKGLVRGRGCAPSEDNFSYFLLKIPCLDAFWHVYVLNHTPMGGILTPFNPSSVRHWFSPNLQHRCFVTVARIRTSQILHSKDRGMRSRWNKIMLETALCNIQRLRSRVKLVCSFYARHHICWARYMLSPVRLSVCLSVCLPHGWIIRKRLKLGSCNFYIHTYIHRPTYENL